jgi:hypothetical protein
MLTDEKYFAMGNEGKRPLVRSRRRWENWIRIYLRETGWGGCGVDSVVSGWRPVAGCCECGDEPSGSGAEELVSCWFLVVCYLLTYLWGTNAPPQPAQYRA